MGRERHPILSTRHEKGPFTKSQPKKKACLFEWTCNFAWLQVISNWFIKVYMWMVTDGFSRLKVLAFSVVHLTKHSKSGTSMDEFRIEKQCYFVAENDSKRFFKWMALLFTSDRPGVLDTGFSLVLLEVKGVATLDVGSPFWIQVFQAAWHVKPGIWCLSGRSAVSTVITVHFWSPLYTGSMPKQIASCICGMERIFPAGVLLR